MSFKIVCKSIFQTFQTYFSIKEMNLRSGIEAFNIIICFKKMLLSLKYQKLLIL